MKANFSKWQGAQAEGSFKGSERLAQLIAKGKAETNADKVKARAGVAGQHRAAGREYVVVEKKKKSTVCREVIVRETSSAERDRALTGRSMLSLMYML